MVTDHFTPKVSGIELLSKLRSPRMKLPVILVSGSITAQEVNRHGRLQPATGFFRPYTGSGFLGKMEETLHKTDNAPEKREALSGWHNQPSNKALSL
jgi:CheY-like chemotaxis protein